MQAARSEYEIDLCQVTLHAKLRRIGWGYEEIMAAVLNPADGLRLSVGLAGYRLGARAYRGVSVPIPCAGRDSIRGRPLGGTERFLSVLGPWAVLLNLQAAAMRQPGLVWPVCRSIPTTITSLLLDGVSIPNGGVGKYAARANHWALR